jgi:uncharacterized protein (TIGR03382 family)
MDFAAGTTQELRVSNAGEGRLEVEVIDAPAGVLVSTLAIPTRGDAPLRVFVPDPDAFAAGPLSITVATNDPDRQRVTIQLGKDVGGTDPGEPAPEASDAAGCSTGSPSGLGAGFVLALVLVRRRRRTT